MVLFKLIIYWFPCFVLGYYLLVVFSCDIEKHNSKYWCAWHFFSFLEKWLQFCITPTKSSNVGLFKFFDRFHRFDFVLNFFSLVTLRPMWWLWLWLVLWQWGPDCTDSPMPSRILLPERSAETRPRGWLYRRHLPNGVILRRGISDRYVEF